MIIKKITAGFVIQTFTTECRFPVHQEFIAGDDVQYEDSDGIPLEPSEIEWEDGDKKEPYLPFESEIEWEDGDKKEPYLPFDMVQPNPRGVDSSMEEHSGHKKTLK